MGILVRSTGPLRLRALLLHVCWLAVAACGAESASEAPQGGSDTEQGAGDSARMPAPTGPAACVCNPGQDLYACSDDDTPIMDVADWCAASGDPCPATLEVWRSCSSRGLLSAPGRVGYLLTPCEGGLTQVYYIYGFGDHTYWLYDANGALAGRGMRSDDGSSVTCGPSPDGCFFAFSAGGDVEALSPAAADAGAANRAAPECEGL
jgi:hypothetical protein